LKNNTGIHLWIILFVVSTTVFGVLSVQPKIYAVGVHDPQTANLHIAIEVLQYTQTTARFHVIYTLTSSSDFNYNYSRTSSDIKPRILVSYNETNAGVVEYVGIYGWTRVDTRRNDVYQARAEATYTIACTSSGIYPFDEYAHHIYLAPNGVTSPPPTVSVTTFQKGLSDLVPAGVVNPANNAVPTVQLLSQTMSEENKTGRFSYSTIWDVRTILSRKPTYQLVMAFIGIMLIIVSVLLPLILVLPNGLRAGLRRSEFWKDMILFYPVFWFTYQQAFGPAWITWIDYLIIIGTFMWLFAMLHSAWQSRERASINTTKE